MVRHEWLDNLRAVACMFVVMLHTAAPYLYKIDNIERFNWEVGNLFDSFTRTCVPLFFMISGFLFFNEKEVKLKNFLRILTALIFYSLISLIYLKLINSDLDIINLIKTGFHKPVFYHLWFFYSLIVVYCFAYFVKIRDDRSLFLFLFFSFILCVYFNPIEFKESPMDGIGYYILYSIFGAFLGRFPIFKKRCLIVILLIIFFLASFFIFFKTSKLSFEDNIFNGKYYSYFSIPVFIGALSLFVFFKLIEIPRSLKGLFLMISENSLAIYGVHAIILSFMDFKGIRFYNKSYFDIPAVFFITIFLSAVISVLIKKIDKKGFVS